MSGVPSFAQIRAQVESIRGRYSDARAIGIGMPALDEATPAPSVLRIGSEELPVVRCGSVLALRERFVDLPAAGPPPFSTRSPRADTPRSRAVFWMQKRPGGICSRPSPESRAASATRKHSLPGRWTARPRRG